MRPFAFGATEEPLLLRKQSRPISSLVLASNNSTYHLHFQAKAPERWPYNAIEPPRLDLILFALTRTLQYRLPVRLLPQ